MTPEEMKKRTKQFALRIIRLIESLPRTPTAGVIGGQLLRAGTSVGSNYRAACCSRSAADFISRMGIVEEEADESAFWIELLVETGIVNERSAAALLQESKEIVAIAVASVKTARGGARQSRASR